MKNLTTFRLVLLMFVGVIAFSCAKERSPSLHITVIDENGIPASGAVVHAWPSNDATQMGSTVNEAEMDKTGTTDAAGYVTLLHSSAMIWGLSTGTSASDKVAHK